MRITRHKISIRNGIHKKILPGPGPVEKICRHGDRDQKCFTGIGTGQGPEKSDFAVPYRLDDFMALEKIRTVSEKNKLSSLALCRSKKNKFPYHIVIVEVKIE